MLLKIKKCILFLVLILLIIITAIIINKKEETGELISVKSEKELMRIYENYEEDNEILSTLIGFPSTIFEGVIDIINGNNDDYDYDFGIEPRYSGMLNGAIGAVGETSIQATTDSVSSAKSKLSSSIQKDYSTTNIQVENVDEADITKTDGNYIYSISDRDIIITDVQDPSNIKVVSKIQEEEFIPEDIILYKNKLAIIYENKKSSGYTNTIVKIYNIENKENPEKVEEYTLYSKYYTSRCIDGQLFVICSDRIRKENDEIITYYEENNEKKKINISDIKYIKNTPSKEQTIISSIDLNDTKDVKINTYLFDTENAYVSQNNIYLLNYSYNEEKQDIYGRIKALLTKGVIGFIKKDKEDNEKYDYTRGTTIYKFEIEKDGSLKYQNKAREEGKTIDQFSVDEYEENLRVALTDYNGSRVVVFDKKMNKIGETESLSKGEKMYSTRFLGNKAYMVTYKNTDPLYVIDVSDPSKPNVLGKLKIPGYSTYLHPYDENHLIGFGMQTEEKDVKDLSGKLLYTNTVVTGMKMALFDVSDVNNPIQISQEVIGDRNTTSAILTNHKAVLFSKEKELLAIPVNKYKEDFETRAYEDDISMTINSYKNYSSQYKKEGYFVYNINLKDGFSLKGIIEHDEDNSTNGNSLYGKTNLLRGLWIENNLFTVSENMMMVNNLEDLKLISKIKIK